MASGFGPQPPPLPRICHQSTAILLACAMSSFKKSLELQCKSKGHGYSIANLWLHRNSMLFVRLCANSTDKVYFYGAYICMVYQHSYVVLPQTIAKKT